MFQYYNIDWLQVEITGQENSWKTRKIREAPAHPSLKMKPRLNRDQWYQLAPVYNAVLPSSQGGLSPSPFPKLVTTDKGSRMSGERLKPRNISE